MAHVQRDKQLNHDEMHMLLVSNVGAAVIVVSAKWPPVR